MHGNIFFGKSLAVLNKSCIMLEEEEELIAVF